MKSTDMALILLAAGRSRRFGYADKLMADLGGRPLGLHVAQCVSEMRWRQKLAVVASDGLRDGLMALGFETVTPASDAGIGDNLALAARQVNSATGVLVCLADMPFVPLTHIKALLSALGDGITIAVSAAGDAKVPPVAFSATHIATLRGLSGDQGARRILISAAVQTVILDAAADELFDIDTVVDMKRARERFR
ncbi:nucleotidyltransferase family protein [Asticcacaulis excentricus]|uniref:MobA-like NTP transferase domain-containing protein n=1 Tax=Asticcacaulis excentricus (strain ATCC 15261 / DSM 4724 / KCTC 12464 / NCIMB 9791 / VKM B-1370 / CB 48) TaxID=573065 RepID=E8RTV0_ASTEC|nr:nucleotidyltransferase family protein [Asticcacaulis excentricus]ADU14921.1 hypothetical protein Astex_3287 [Asticcacaulis excentricus CB 48]